MLRKSIASSSNFLRRAYSASPIKTPIPAFAFDIDGVLLRDGVPIGNSLRALKAVTAKAHGGDHPTGVPYIFLTNGGGVPEAKRAQQLQDIFDIYVTPKQVCLSHSPMAPLSSKYQDDLVLVVGMHDVKEVAEMYGFTNVITPADIKSAFPLLAPHSKYDPQYFPAHKPTSSSFKNASAAVEEAHKLLSKVSAVLVMHDPRDWYVDLQIVLDVLVTGRENAAEALRAAEEAGEIAPTRCSSPSCSGGCGGSSGGCGSGGCACSKRKIPHPPIYFSNPDLVYSANYRLPRLAQGAFALCLNQLYLGHTGDELTPHAFGKPTPATYKYADTLIRAEADRIYGKDHPIAMTYGIGDNPCADIHGANQAGPHWASVFVKTGSIKPSTDPRKIPRYTFENVDVAVHTLLGKHGI